MSRRDRIRRKNRSEFIIEPAPREMRFSLPPESHFVAERVRNTYNDKPVDIISRDKRRIDTGKNLHDVSFQNLRRLQITDGNPREYYHRNEVVFLPSQHPVCRTRENRRKVLFAFNKTGRGGQRPPRLPNLILKCIK